MRALGTVVVVAATALAIAWMLARCLEACAAWRGQ